MYNSIKPGKVWKDIDGNRIQAHNENTWKSDYVWLPIAWEGEKPVLRWQDEWRI